MFKKPLVKKTSQPLDVAKLHKLVMELDENKQESISGGAIGTEQLLGAYNFFSNQQSIPKALVLLFPNPFA